MLSSDEKCLKTRLNYSILTHFAPNLPRIEPVTPRQLTLGSANWSTSHIGWWLCCVIMCKNNMQALMVIIPYLTRGVIRASFAVLYITRPLVVRFTWSKAYQWWPMVLWVCCKSLEEKNQMLVSLCCIFSDSFCASKWRHLRFFALLQKHQYHFDAAEHIHQG